jgi:hypothetical protein
MCLPVLTHFLEKYTLCIYCAWAPAEMQIAEGSQPLVETITF